MDAYDVIAGGPAIIVASSNCQRASHDTTKFN